jgi:hypothetical protein
VVFKVADKIAMHGADALGQIVPRAFAAVHTH